MPTCGPCSSRPASGLRDKSIAARSVRHVSDGREAPVAASPNPRSCGLPCHCKSRRWGGISGPEIPACTLRAPGFHTPCRTARCYVAWPHRRDRSGKSSGRAFQFFRRRQLVDQAPALSGFCVNGLTGQHQPTRPAFADETREERSVNDRRDSNLDLGHDELSVVARDPQVARSRQFEADTNAPAVHLRDGRNRKIAYRLAQGMQVSNEHARAGSRAASSLMSAPPTNVFSPLPAIITTRTSGLPPIVRSVCVSARCGAADDVE